MTNKSYVILLALALGLSACAQKNNNSEESVGQAESNVEPAEDCVVEEVSDLNDMTEETPNSNDLAESSTDQMAETNNSSEASEDKVPIISFDTTSHNFGKVKYGETKTFEFTFKNTGEADLYVVDSNVFCSCMKLTLPKDPIAPGQTGKIIMNFTGDQTGSFMKNAQIYTNCKRPMTRLNIEGEVVE